MKYIKYILIISLIMSAIGCSFDNDDKLPLPEISEGVRGDLGIDKNINEDTIDKYLNRDDAVYRDLRMLVDSASYEEIGGSSIVDGIIEGFEIVPYPYICNVNDLPLEVGETYSGNTLFTKTDDGYSENYDESLMLLENLFPKDKIIFLMCGGGGYAGMCKELLVYYGWDKNKIYNVGGFWYYKGNHKIDIKKEDNGNISFDMNNIIYHNIDFDTLNPKDGYSVNKETTNTLSFKEANIEVLNKGEVLLFVYLKGCSACNAFKIIVNDVLLYNNLDIYQIEFNNLESLDLDIDLKYVPSLIIIKDGKAEAYLDSSKEEDKSYYKDSLSLSRWLSNYIDVNIVETGNINNEECDDITCELR